MGKHEDVKVVINADDLGMDECTNALVFELMGKNKITSATIMANGDACKRAADEHDKFKRCSFGVHLNLTSGEPLTGSNGNLKPILSDDGIFLGLEHLICVKKNRSLLIGIFDEFFSQIERLQSLGVKITHIDSHQHIHNIPALLPVVKLVQRKFSIRRIRLSKNIYNKNDKNIIRAAKKAAFNFLLKKVYRSYSTDYFTNLETFYHLEKSAIMKGSYVEVMVHLKEDSIGWSDYNVLQESWQDDLTFPVELIQYSQVGSP